MTTTASRHTDEDISAALDHAVYPPLLAALAQATGNLTLLDDTLRPDPARLATSPQGGLTPEQLAAARARCQRAIRHLLDGTGHAPRPVTSDELLRIVEFTVGGQDMAPYLPLLAEELDLDEADSRAPGWHKSTVAPDREFTVAIVGAGMSGLLAAYRLQQAGLSFVVLEKNATVGGTWFENTYPGCRVDNPSHLYSYSFAQRADWRQHYSPQSTLLEYFESFADTTGLDSAIKFDTEVVEARYDDGACSWSLKLRSAKLGESTMVVDAVIMAVGQLNRPHIPALDGHDEFAGPAFHSAQWDHDIDLSGKRVAVIGTGASAIQFIPEIATVAERVSVFQRNPPWMAPTPDYHEAVPPGLRWLYEHIPYFSRWHRFWMFWLTSDGTLDNVRVDPSWPTERGSVSAANDVWRQLLTHYLHEQFADRPDLLAKVVPRYPVGAKRILRDNGLWARTLKRDNVELLTEPIARLQRDSIRTTSGRETPIDVLIYGTGFEASRFLTPMKVIGRTGIDLHEHWSGEARAHLGITIPDFPNLFCLYGPNTNLVVNGSIIFCSECEVRYVMDCLRLLLEGGHRALSCRQSVHDAYNRSIDDQNGKMAWGASSVSSWYKNESGRVTQNWPWRLLDFWTVTRAVNPADYELIG